MDWTAEEMKELKCLLFGQPLRPTRAHDISPIMRLEFGVFGINDVFSCISESSLSITLSLPSQESASGCHPLGSCPTSTELHLQPATHLFVSSLLIRPLHSIHSLLDPP
ncbi:hypothetical protein IG631_09478 [Alternaria alternata]|nr:hypothetical protein IG631_09478 [Alternaria alternata]